MFPLKLLSRSSGSFDASIFQALHGLLSNSGYQAQHAHFGAADLVTNPIQRYMAVFTPAADHACRRFLHYPHS